MSMTWDPTVYLRHADDRARPFHDLMARVGAETPARVVDLGCGPGGLTRLLADRWPAASVLGVDSSSAMVERAAAYAIPGRCEFARADLREWAPTEASDIVLSNATLQWVPDHQPQTYLDVLSRAGCTVDAWQTTYLHVLAGDDAVLGWVRGTALRPVLDALDSADTAEFLDAYAGQLRRAYPREPYGTVFAFQRTFVVARKATL